MPHPFFPQTASFMIKKLLFRTLKIYLPSSSANISGYKERPRIHHESGGGGGTEQKRSFTVST